jgi:hypothetical protein
MYSNSVYVEKFLEEDKKQRQELKDNQKDLHKLHQAAQQQYTYFILAAAGASIGFTLQNAQGVPLNLSLVFLGEAVISWGLSFFFGCLCSIKVHASIGANYNLLGLQIGNHPKQPKSLEEHEAALKGVQSAIEINMNKAQLYNNLQ